MKTYMGKRTGDAREVIVVTYDETSPLIRDSETCYPGGKTTRLRHVVRHSPDGFEWGYAGSGPADLALSILADHFGESPRSRSCPWARPVQSDVYYQQFKFDYVLAWGDQWQITEEEIARWLERQRAEKAPLN